MINFSAVVVIGRKSNKCNCLAQPGDVDVLVWGCKGHEIMVFFKNQDPKTP